MVLTYRSFVKRNYANMRGICLIWIVKNVYLFIVLLIALVFGIMGANGSSSHKRSSEPSDDDMSYKYLWFIAVIIETVIYSILLITISLIFYLVGLFRTETKTDLCNKTHFKEITELEQQIVDSKKTAEKSDSSNNLMINISKEPINKDFSININGEKVSQTNSSYQQTSQNFSTNNTKTYSKEKDGGYY